MVAIGTGLRRCGQRVGRCVRRNPLLIIEDDDIVHVLSFDPERHPPVARDRYGMVATAITVVAMNWLTLMASCFASRSTSALIEGGRRSG